MGIHTTTTGFSMYSPRRLARTVFNGFQGCGIDLFTDPADQNPNSFQDLTNVLPTISGDFVRRWGLNQRGTALPRDNGYNRMFRYAATADSTWTGTADTYVILGTDNTHVDVLYSETGGSFSYTFPAYTAGADVFGLTSRDFFYVCNGAEQPRKLAYFQRTSDTHSNWGILTPPGMSIAGSAISYLDNLNKLSAGTGQGYSSTPTITISGGGGTGATATAEVVGGVIRQLDMTSGGSGYNTPATLVITVTDGTGVGAGNITGIIDLDSTSSTFGKVTALILAGPMTFNKGRRYGLAFKNSITGHVSDFIYSYYLAAYPQITKSIGDTGSGSYNNIQTGCDLIQVEFRIPGGLSFLDPQFDQIIILAAADGGDVTTMYEVKTTLRTDWLSHFPGSIYHYYDFVDTLPDTQNDLFAATDTLLNHNIYVEPDGQGGTIGISDNIPPPFFITKPVFHKGRLFGTDGKSIYFSKSIGEVTTSTGLITSKWEEAWPGIYKLDVAYGNERINALLSDGDILYIGTSETIYRLLGDNIYNFSIPAAIFRGVGVDSQDAWTVIYKDNIPAGYMWLTPDYKIMLSDFNTYEEIGRYIYPLIGPDGGSFGALRQIQSLSFGPYSLAIISVQTTNSQPTYLVFDTKNGGWYLWKRVLYSTPGDTQNTATILTYTGPDGISHLYTVMGNEYSPGVPHSYLQYFDPLIHTDVALSGNANQTITWSLETSWLDFEDSATFKVLNDLEVWSMDQAVVATVTASYDTYFTPIAIKVGALVNGPLGTRKLFLAGTKSGSRYYKLKLATTDTTSLAATNPVLRQFSFEHFPQTRL